MKHKSQGTHITNERLRMLDSNRPDAGHVVLHDLTDASGNPCGTKAILQIPLRTEWPQYGGLPIKS